MSEKIQPLARLRRWRAGRALLVVGVLGALSLGATAPASAAATSSLRYSTDGGTTWSTSATVAAGGTVLVRQWYDNTGSTTETGASLRTTVPSGFTLQGGSTKICLNPSTTNPSSPNASEQTCANSAEGSVWSGSTLQISPSAGFYGESNGSTSGSTAWGRKRYLNLHQCVYHQGTNNDHRTEVTNVSASAFHAGSNVSNTADSSVSCGPGTGSSAYTIVGVHTGVGSYDLLGKRYFNLHHCSWVTSTQTINAATNASANFGTGTNASNTADASVTCDAGASGYSFHAPTSGVAALDLSTNRYINIHQCMWTRNDTGDSKTGLVNTTAATNYRGGSNASNTVDTAEVCGTSSSPYTFFANGSGVETFDLLDTARGAGYVQYALTAPANPTPAACAGAFSGTEAFSQPASYVSTQSGTLASTGALTVDFSALSDPCPTDPIPSVDPAIGAGLLATAVGGYLLYRQQRARVA